jgi:hypothetical protein
VNDELPQHFSDRFGWEEMAQSLEAAVGQLPPAQRETAVVVTGNYGEAFALEYWTKQYALPPCYTPHNNGYLWGPPPGDATAVLLLMNATPEELAKRFGAVRQVGEHTAKYSRGNEARIAIFYCTQPKTTWAEAWPNYKHFI